MVKLMWTKKTGGYTYPGRALKPHTNDYVVLDVETNGFSQDHCVILEMAAVRVENGIIVDSYSSLINPRARIRLLEDINGITWNHLKDAPSLDEVWPEVLDFIKDSIIVAHNAKFDIRFMNATNLRVNNKPFTNNFIDTLEWSRHYYSYFSSHKLGYLAAKHGISVAPTHRALDDALATHELYQILRTKAGGRWW